MVERMPHSWAAAYLAAMLDSATEPHRCSDDGVCHHDCFLGTGGCFREKHAGPLSGVFPDDEWPDNGQLEVPC